MGCFEVTAATFGDVNCASACCDGGVLTHPDQADRVAKCDISSYRWFDDTTSIPPRYIIAFTMKNGMMIEWVFGNSIIRDEALAKIDLAMGAQSMG